jgi:putative FmdB family regulatory protein
VSKLMMFDFVCPECALKFEDLVNPAMRETECPECKATATRILSKVRIDRTRIAVTNGASPESIAHFDRIHRQRKAIEERKMQDHGDYGPAAGAD